MAIKVYNTMTRRKEEFVPMTPGKASIYVCGVTPYNHPHIGNARPFVTWDVIHRFLEHEILLTWMIRSSIQRMRRVYSGVISAAVTSNRTLR